MYKAPCEWVLFKVPTISMMSDCEEDLDDFPTFSTEKHKQTGRIYGWSTSRGINRSMDSCKWNYYENSTTSNESTSWFKYDELIDDWLSLTVLAAGKRGPALKNRLGGDAEMDKGLLDREFLRPEDGINHFRDTLRPHFIRGAQSAFLWQFYEFTRA